MPSTVGSWCKLCAVASLQSLGARSAQITPSIAPRIMASLGRECPNPCGIFARTKQRLYPIQLGHSALIHRRWLTCDIWRRLRSTCRRYLWSRDLPMKPSTLSGAPSMLSKPRWARNGARSSSQITRRTRLSVMPVRMPSKTTSVSLPDHRARSLRVGSSFSWKRVRSRGATTFASWPHPWYAIRIWPSSILTKTGSHALASRNFPGSSPNTHLCSPRRGCCSAECSPFGPI